MKNNISSGRRASSLISRYNTPPFFMKYEGITYEHDSAIPRSATQT